jgi:hypothetical protein
MPPGVLELRNSFGDTGYGGPLPPKNSGPHQYAITIQALNIESLPVGPFSTAEECAQEMRGKILATATVTGIYQR